MDSAVRSNSAECVPYGRPLKGRAEGPRIGEAVFTFLAAPRGKRSPVQSAARLRGMPLLRTLCLRRAGRGSQIGADIAVLLSADALFPDLTVETLA